MNTAKPKFKILFLCTGNSARSIFAEYLLRRMAPERFEVFSAGSHPKRAPHPLTIDVLRDDYLIDASDARSKSLDEFVSVEFDFVITLCDIAMENCPVWPGQPIIAHWSSPDPSNFDGSKSSKHHYFWKVSQQINRRLELLCSLPFDKLDLLRLAAETRAIGNKEGFDPS